MNPKKPKRIYRVQSQNEKQLKHNLTELNRSPKSSVCCSSCGSCGSSKTHNKLFSKQVENTGFGFVFNKKKTKKITLSKKIEFGPHSQEVIDVIVSSLLGHGSAQKRNHATRIMFHCFSRNVTYAKYIHKLMSSKGYASPHIKKMNVKIGRGGKQYFSVKFRTFSYTSWSYLYDLFYKDEAKPVMNTWCPNTCRGVFSVVQTTKTIDNMVRGPALLKHNSSSCFRVIHKEVPDTIDMYLTPRVFAILLMEHGDKCGAGIKLCVNCLMIENHVGGNKHNIVLLQRAIQKVFDMKVKLHEQKATCVLYFDKTYVPQLQTLLAAYVIPSMRYKLHM